LYEHPREITNILLFLNSKMHLMQAYYNSIFDAGAAIRSSDLWHHADEFMRAINAGNILRLCADLNSHSINVSFAPVRLSARFNS
jgi:hypothetical protein